MSQLDSGWNFPVDDLTGLAAAITLTEQAGAIGTATLMRALMAGRIALLPLLPDGSAGKFKQWARSTKDRPAVALIGDDDGFERGANGWTQAHRAVAWARSILIHGAGAEPFHYELAIISAELTHRMLVIECGTATVGGWIELVKAAPHRPSTLIITPREGVHPVAVRREVMN